MMTNCQTAGEKALLAAAPSPAAGAVLLLSGSQQLGPSTTPVQAHHFMHAGQAAYDSKHSSPNTPVSRLRSGRRKLPAPLTTSLHVAFTWVSFTANKRDSENTQGRSCGSVKQKSIRGSQNSLPREHHDGQKEKAQFPPAPSASCPSPVTSLGFPDSSLHPQSCDPS